ncbi:MATE family efflux transporter [Commensalibacter papalotli (ex Servin-Garciduenas et al. 2014)]|uniref:Multi antimicrobial extrusion protein MatE n=1 Tax=Commensalibacter papalotli (ex Servin-Garciduenas et al. 2014) TaxID=1208583 RepID=W7DL70_9PROT|nr:MATE family efflux transporter [Commensalibacter papalotli (ex Servin-Garciduenas et al. 2014)]EUK17987.1 multi antimicrobial extrusion protein MatE [Commensalibacter papalotli (ex Servin-Garciduenas et al. 2014)]
MKKSADTKAIHKPRFCEGSIMRHVIVMAGTGTVGLMAVFLVDFLNLFYISRLGNSHFTAAIGFSNAIGFLQMGICIGMSIGTVVVTARLIGAGQYERAKRMVSSFVIFTTIIMILIGLTVAFFNREILYLLGARGIVLNQASHFIVIVSPFLFLIGLGMVLSGLLRAMGDAKRSMNVTIIGALIAGILDPIFILVFHLGLEGAAISTVCSRLGVVLLGFYSLRRYELLEKPQWNFFIPDSLKILKISFPAILTNLATPVGGLFVIHTMSNFSSDAISGQTAIDRIIPVAFAFVFALTGSVGPIISQNYGAGLRERMQETLIVSLKLVCLCVLCAWVIFFLSQDLFVRMFSLKAEGEALMRLFCHWVIINNLFLGMLFVSNTAFNNLGYPLFATFFNWGRATLGTIPFVSIGMSYGPQGVLIGQALGVVPFGIMAVCCAFFVIKNIRMDRPI